MMTKIRFCQNILKNQKEFFDSKKTINPKIRIESLKKLKKTIIRYEDEIVIALKGTLRPSMSLYTFLEFGKFILYSSRLIFLSVIGFSNYTIIVTQRYI